MDGWQQVRSQMEHRKDNPMRNISPIAITRIARCPLLLSLSMWNAFPGCWVRFSVTGGPHQSSADAWNKGVIQRNAKFLRLSKPLSVLNGPEPCWILICCTKRWPVSTISNSSVTRYSYQLQSRESAPSDCICCFPSNLLRCGISWRRLPWVFLAPSAGSSPYQTDVCSCKWFLQIQCRSTRRVQLRSHLHGRL